MNRSKEWRTLKVIQWWWILEPTQIKMEGSVRVTWKKACEEIEEEER